MSTLGMWADVIWAVFTLILAWRVWRLEGKAEAGLRAARSLDDVFLPARVKTRSGDTIRAFVATANEVSDVRKELMLLARALGYEWKRTEAKEGWEKKASPPGFYEFMRHRVGLETCQPPEILVPPKPPAKRPTKKRRATH